MSTYELRMAISVFFSALLVWRYFSTLFKEKYSKRATCAFVFVAYSVNYSSYFLHSLLLTTISFILVNVLILHFLYKLSIQNILFHVLLITCLMLGSEILALYITQVLSHDIHLYLTNGFIGMSLVIITKLAFFIGLQILALLFKKNKTFPTNDKKMFVYLWFTPFATFGLYCFFLDLMLKFRLPLSDLILITVISIAFLLANVMVFVAYYHSQEVNYKYTSSQIQLEKEQKTNEFYQMLDEQIQNQSILIHDINKHLTVLENLSGEKNYDKIQQYLNEIKTSNAFQIKINFCDNHILNLILSQYHNLCQKSSIDTNFVIATNSINFLCSNEITSIFSNLLDNAYESTKNLQDSFIYLSVSANENNQSTIVMLNSCSSVINTSNNNEKTTRHGIGLKSIKKIVENHKGVSSFYFDENEKVFHSVITLCS